MTTAKDRVNQELRELLDKIAKLEAFHATSQFDNLDALTRDLLNVQRGAMFTYASILRMRLKAWSSPA